MIIVKNITPPITIDWRRELEVLEFIGAPDPVIREAAQKAKEIGVEERPPEFHKKDREYPAPQILGDILRDFVYKVSPPIKSTPSYHPFWVIRKLLINGKEVPVYSESIMIQDKRVLNDGDVVEVVVELSGD